MRKELALRGPRTPSGSPPREEAPRAKHGRSHRSPLSHRRSRSKSQKPRSRSHKSHRRRRSRSVSRSPSQNPEVPKGVLMKYTPKPAANKRSAEVRKKSPSLDLSRLRRRSPLPKPTRKSRNESSSDSEEDRMTKIMGRYLARGT